VIAVSENTERIEPVERFGFITVVEVPELGFAGGMLVVSPQGRPIEFHCTPPVAENRTQKILYGQTYRGFLFCDQIAASIFEKSKARPQFTKALPLVEPFERIRLAIDEAQAVAR
jgi:hypothetical protein